MPIPLFVLTNLTCPRPACSSPPADELYNVRGYCQALAGQLESQSSEVSILASRCLEHLVEAHPPSAQIMVGTQGILASLCRQLTSIQ